MLDIRQLDRYARHIVLPGVGAAGQVALRQAEVLVVGAGGLGAPILQYLVAAGVGRIGIADDDVVSLSNLQRQVLFATEDVGHRKTDVAVERLAALNPDVELVAIEERIDERNIAATIDGFHMVVDGSDNFATRYVVNDACVHAGVPLVYGAVSQFEGQVSVLNGAVDGVAGPCYRCMFPVPPAEGTVPSCSEAGVFGALPGAIGSLMAGEAIKWVVGVGTSAVGVLLHLDMADGRMHRFQLSRDPECPVCGPVHGAPRGS